MFISVKDINLASILATLGVPVKIGALNNVRTGNGYVELQFPKASIPTVKTLHEAGGIVVDRKIHQLLRDGKLAQIDPHHDALDCSRALINRERILDWLKKGLPMGLKRVDNINRCIYCSTDYIPQSAEQFPTQNIKLVAALGVIGAHVCKITGTEGHHIFYVSRYTEALAGERYDAYLLAKELLNGTIAPEHPLSWAYTTLKNRERLLDLIHNKNPQLYITRRNSPNNACALIQPTEDKKQMDKWLNDAAKHCGRF